MKKTFQHSILFILFVVVISCGAAKAELLDMTGYNNGKSVDYSTFQVINDKDPWNDSQYGDTVVLYKFLNENFGEAIEKLYGGLFTSSDQAFQKLGVSQENATSWIAGPDAYWEMHSRIAQAELSLFSGDQLIGSYGRFSTENLENGGSNIASIEEGAFDLKAKASHLNGPTFEFSIDSSKNADGFAHFIAFDITDLVNYGLVEGDDGWVQSAFLFGLEDIMGAETHGLVDWDYNDSIGIVYNVSYGDSSGNSGTPEPASILMLGLGLVGVPFARKYWKKK